MASAKWSTDALQDLEKIDQIIVRRIIEKVMWLESHFTDVVPEQLHRELKGLYKLRVGDYRAIYSIQANSIVIEAVGHRREIYK